METQSFKEEVKGRLSAVDLQSQRLGGQRGTQGLLGLHSEFQALSKKRKEKKKEGWQIVESLRVCDETVSSSVKQAMTVTTYR